MEHELKTEPSGGVRWSEHTSKVPKHVCKGLNECKGQGACKHGHASARKAASGKG